MLDSAHVNDNIDVVDMQLLMTQSSLFGILQTHYEKITKIEKLTYVNLIITCSILIIFITIIGFGMQVYSAQKSNLQKVIF